jgi:hypothetical protein
VYCLPPVAITAISFEVGATGATFFTAFDAKGFFAVFVSVVAFVAIVPLFYLKAKEMQGQGLG